MKAVADAKIAIKDYTTIARMSYDRFCFWFAVIDIFFLPYFKWVSVSFSVPLVFMWLMLNWNWILKKSEGAVLSIIVLAMIGSIIISVLYPFDLKWDTSLSTTIKRSIQYFMCMGYFLFFADYFKKYKVNINKILVVFLICLAVFALLYHVFPYEYATLKLNIYPADAHTRRYLNNEIGYRFNYILVDPNNVAYMTDGVLAWLLLNDKMETVNKIIMVLIGSFVVLSTQSGGGILSLAAVIMLYFLSRIDYKKWTISIRVETLVALLLFAVLTIILLSRENVIGYINKHLLDSIQARLSYYGTFKNMDISGGRFKDFFGALKYLNPIMIAIGAGKEGISSESGHLYFIGLYGFPAYVAFLWFTFRIKKCHLKGDFIWMLPFFIGFTMNIAIGEFKWLAIYYLLLAKSRTEAMRLCEQKKTGISSANKHTQKI